MLCVERSKAGDKSRKREQYKEEVTNGERDSGADQPRLAVSNVDQSASSQSDVTTS
jgi:hypothetical protein